MTQITRLAKATIMRAVQKDNGTIGGKPAKDQVILQNSRINILA
jgi:hypothetical protein